MLMNKDSTGFPSQLASVAAEIEAVLKQLLDDRPLEGEISRPGRLAAAMRHAALDGGKRLRPFLLVETASIFDAPRRGALMAGAALELVHCYSLVHDDLPAMDDDDLRRGRPTVHRAFDEATAILTGDALLTTALEVAIGAGETGGAHAMRRPAAARILLAAIGTSGMIGGQVDDLIAGGGVDRQADEPTVRSIQERKTGALLRACPVVGGVLAGADAATLSRLDAYGADLGLAFQIVDDILDIEGSP